MPAFGADHVPSSQCSTLAKARKKAATGGGFLGFGGSLSSRMEEAHDLYTSAANQFKLEKKWKESGDAFCEAGECSVKAGEEDDAANDYWAAGKAYKKSHPERDFQASLFRSCDRPADAGSERQWL